MITVITRRALARRGDPGNIDIDSAEIAALTLAFDTIVLSGFGIASQAE